MVTDSFTNEMQQEGAELTQKLDRAGLKVRAALWLFDPDTHLWRLLYGIDEVDEMGPRSVYKKVRSAILTDPKMSGELDLRDVAVESPNNRLFGLLRSAINTGPGISGIRFARNSINGTFIEDSFIYRLS
jgi:hypothetical protein